MSFLEKIAPALFIILLGVFPYVITFDFPFVFDDIPGIVENESIRNLSDLGSIWSFYTTRFVTMVSFAMNFHAGFLEVRGFRVTNLFIHLCMALTVYLFVYQIFLLQRNSLEHGENFAKNSASLKLYRLTATFAAMIFVVHPIQTEAVTYIWQRNTSLASFFYLAALTMHILAMAEWKAKGRLWVYFQILAYLLGFFSMLSKQLAFTLPLAILLLEALFVGNPFKGPRVRKAMGLLWLGMLLLIPVVQWNWGDRSIDDIKASDGSRLMSWEYFLTQMNVLWTYFRLLFFPINQNLDYDYPIIRNFSFHTFLSMFLHLCLLSWAFRLRRRIPALCFGICFFYLSLSVESTFVPLADVIFEHRLYLPSVGFILCATSALVFFSTSRERLQKLCEEKKLSYLYIAATLPCIPLLLLTLQRNLVWHSEESLWRSAALLSPDKYRTNFNLGNALLKSGKFNEARTALVRAGEIKPMDAMAPLNLGVACDSLGRQDDAWFYFKKALDLNPENSLVLENIGVFYARKSDLKLAEYYFRKAIGKNPQKSETYLSLGQVLLSKQEISLAERIFEKSFKMKSLNYLPFKKTGDSLMEQGYFSLAHRSFEKSLDVLLKTKITQKLEIEIRSKSAKCYSMAK